MVATDRLRGISQHKYIAYWLVCGSYGPPSIVPARNLVAGPWSSKQVTAGTSRNRIWMRTSTYLRPSDPVGAKPGFYFPGRDGGSFQKHAFFEASRSSERGR